MTLQDLKDEIEFELNLDLKELEKVSTKDLKTYIKKLKYNKKQSKTLLSIKRSYNAIPNNINSHIIDVDAQIYGIKKIIKGREESPKKIDLKETKKKFTLNQKFEILRKTGYIKLVVDKFDDKLQHEIFSGLFDCNNDTSRKIHSGTYKSTNEIRPDDFNSLLNKIKKTKFL